MEIGATRKSDSLMTVKYARKDGKTPLQLGSSTPRSGPRRFIDSRASIGPYGVSERVPRAGMRVSVSERALSCLWRTCGTSKKLGST